VIQLWGKQVVDKKPVNVAAKKGKNTKAIMRAETLKKNASIVEGTHNKIIIKFLERCRTSWRFMNYEEICILRMSRRSADMHITILEVFAAILHNSW